MKIDRSMVEMGLFALMIWFALQTIWGLTKASFWAVIVSIIVFFMLFGFWWDTEEKRVRWNLFVIPMTWAGLAVVGLIIFLIMG